MYWVNGNRLNNVPIHDRSFQYGDGCFTTILTKYGQIQLWPQHKARLQACLDALHITQPDWSRVIEGLESMICPDAKAGLKIHISRGVGGRGYSPTQVSESSVTISAFPFPSHYEQWRQTGVALGICEQRMGLNPLLAGYKHNNRLEQILLKREMDLAGFDDGICLDIHGRVIETTVANLFWCKDGHIFTPCLNNAGVAGIARRCVMDIAKLLGWPVVIDEFALESMLAADEVFITNALLEVAPVKQIGAQQYTIGSMTRRIQESSNS
ncbi:aminodeoxychorismate lyase [Vibrio sp. RC586]|uniref:aminodeoxychorismate lyase n=1 Tax=Vibrio sp. RC586 TaxID=675815 RepID=UPI0001BB7EE5|nr:aminodeoxychorismate lyase [Vibrio sp. RC586]EEY98543.1 aminodeoxychorismate lyase [Vibrio sp. RC586]